MAQIVSSVGVDVSKKELVACRMPGRHRLRASNDRVGWRELSRWCAELGADRIGLEATGGYEYGAAEFLSEAGHTVVILDPYRVRQFRAALAKAKNDPIDGETIARFAQVIEGAPFIPDKVRHQLCEWLVFRRNLIEARKRLENVLEHLRGAELKRAAKRQIAALNAEVARLDRRLARLIAQEPRFAATVRIISSVPGVGPVLTATLLAQVPELGQLSRRAIARLIGVAPLDDDSGARSGVRRIAGGRKGVRRTLYMVAMGAATQHNPVLQAFHQRLCHKGKEPKVALVAAMRKLLVILNAMLATGQTWRVPDQRRAPAAAA